MKNENKNVTVEVPVAAAPAVTAISAPKVTPVHERLYRLIAQPSTPPKGKQRQIVISALASKPNEAITVDEVIKFATAAGLTAVGGVGPSCRYHLHHLVKLGLAKVENPTIIAEEVAA